MLWNMSFYNFSLIRLRTEAAVRNKCNKLLALPGTLLLLDCPNILTCFFSWLNFPPIHNIKSPRGREAILYPFKKFPLGPQSMTTVLNVQSAMSHFHTTCLTCKLVCKLILYRPSLLARHHRLGVCRNFHSI